ncbi:MAG: hypothetical protein ABI707_08130 [Ferruginibacter sp.]
MAIRAVITGDIVNSTKLVAAKEKKLLRVLQEVLVPHPFEFYRGDSFQAYQKNAGGALKTALLCRTAAMGISQGEETTPSDVRISIGIGQAKAPVKTLSTAKGEAFVLSGRAFDEISNANKRLVIATGNTLANEGMQVIADYINAIFKAMTGKQATVIFELLKGQTQQVVARKLKKSKSTISQHVSSGRWAEIEKLLQQYENIINQIS